MLITQVIDGNKLERAGTYRSITDSLNDWRTSIYSSIDRTELMNKYIRNNLDDDFSENEVLQLALMELTVWNIYDSAYSANMAGIIDDDDWSRLNDGACYQYLYLNRQNILLQSTIYDLVLLDFKTHLDESC